MKPMAWSRSTSDRMKFWHSGAWRRTFCRTGRVSGSTNKRCSITSLGTPDISDGCHAKTSEFAQRKEMSALSYFVVRWPLILMVLAKSLSSDTFLVRATPSLERLAFPEAGDKGSGRPSS